MAGNSIFIKQLSQMDFIAVIEVYGSQYKSFDNRGRYYSQNAFGGELIYGRWYQVSIDDTTGYISGNFVTLLPQAQEVNENQGT